MLVTAALFALSALPPIVLDSAFGEGVALFGTTRKPRALIFVTAECPISRKYSPEIRRLAGDYRGEVDFFIVHVDPETGGREATAYAKEFRLDLVSLLDPEHRAAKRAAVRVVPTAVLLDATGKVRYTGRIDDRFPRLGVQRESPRRRDLKLAIDQLLAGEKIAVPKTAAVGCVLPTIS
jgi:thiol-disulfide isomerase/thioredoxin